MLHLTLMKATLPKPGKGPKTERLYISLLGREVRLTITPPAKAAKPTGLENAPMLRGEGLISDMVRQDRR